MVKTKKARLNVYIDPDVHQKIKKLCNESGIPISSLVNSLLRSIVDEKFQNKSLQDFAMNFPDHVIDSLDVAQKASISTADIEKIKDQLKKEILEELKKAK